MRLRSKILAILLACTLWVTPVTAIDIQDTFTIGNVDSTLATLGDNTYLITGANTLKGNGVSISGHQSTAINTNNEWLDIVKDNSGSLLTGVTKLTANTRCLFILTGSGDIYMMDGYPKKVSVTGTENVKFKDVCSVGAVYTFNRAYAISENGDLYFIDAGKAVKVDTVKDCKKLVQIRYDYDDSLGVAILHNDGTVTTGGSSNSSYTKLNFTDIEDFVSINESYTCFILFKSGRVSKYSTYSGETSVIKIPQTENVTRLVAHTRNSKLYIVTDKNVYRVDGTTLVSIPLTVRPVALSNNILIDNSGDYYKVNSISDSNCDLTKLSDEEMKKWANVNPIVSDYELAHFSLERDSIFDRGNACSVEFSLVTNEKPSAFNIYYSKTQNSGDKGSWKLIESNVKFETLNPVEYVTGITDNTGVAIKGYTYRYNWNLDNISDLTDIQIIVEPIY